MSERKDDIEKYLRGELSPSEMHELEKKALSDPFLADALEGASSIVHKEFSKDVAELNRSIRKQIIFTPLRIAAGVIVIIGVGIFLLWPSEQRQQLAEKEKTEVAPTDSIDAAAPVEERKTEESSSRDSRGTKTRELAQLKQEKQKDPTPTTTTLFEPDTIKAQPERLAPAVVSNTHNITGTVTVAEDGLPLPGVTVLVKGTTRGTTTDINGNYSLDVADTTSLVFSFIGMHTNEVTPTDKSTLNIKMTEDVSQLSEVVIARTPYPKEENETPVVKLAEPVGGIRAYDKYLESKRQYPQQALDNDVKGRVIVGFDVGMKGELSNFVVIRSLGYGCDDEVIRLVKEGPDWKPTTEDNKPVESTVHVKMRFDAAKFKKKRQ